MNKLGPWLAFLVLALTIYLVVLQANKPVATAIDASAISTADDPVQAPYSGPDIVRKTGSGVFIIAPVAQYSISALVVSKKRYYLDWNTEVIPIDLALAWGDVASPKYRKEISFSQSGRWFFYTYRQDCPLGDTYIQSHASNNHIIPADSNIFKAIKAVRTGQNISLEGFLVNVRATVKEAYYTMNTSLTRDDSGNGSCEILYVNKVRIGERVYE